MGFIIIKETDDTIKDIYSNGGTARIFKEKDAIQEAYCSQIESETMNDWKFFENPKVKDYLESCGVKYMGNFLLQCDEWAVDTMFATWLNYPLQFACVALITAEDVSIIAGNWALNYLDYLMYVAKERDIYIQLDSFCYLYNLVHFAKKLYADNIEVKIDGRSSKEFSLKEFVSFIYDLEAKYSYITRDLEAGFYSPNMFKEFEPQEMLLSEYISQNDKNGNRNADDFEYPVDKDPWVKDAKIVINDQFDNDLYFRRYPMHMLLEIDGKWKYISNNSSKYPNIITLLTESVLCPEPFDFDRQSRCDVTGYTRAFVLILDCDEVCDVENYWEHILLYAKYDRQKNLVEICDKRKAYHEFHELLQTSEDLQGEEK